MEKYNYLLINNKSYTLFSKCELNSSTYLYLINTIYPYDKLIVKYTNNKIKTITNEKLINKLTRMLLDSYRLEYDILT